MPGSVRVLQVLRPVMPVAAVRLGERTPGGEVVERASFALPVFGIGEVAAGRPRHPIHLLERCPFGRPRRVPVDRVDAFGAALHVVAQPADPAAAADVRELGDGLDPEVDRVDEATRGRQVRRGLHRRGGCGGVQRIHQHVAGLVPRRGPDGQVRQIGEIAYTPRPFRAHAVELRRQAPGPAGSEALRNGQGGRCDDHRGARRGVRVVEMQPVITQRQVRGQLERGLADEAPVELIWGGEVVQLA